MPRYQAQQQSLFGGVGGPQAPQYQIDVPGAIDALTNTVSSGIHQVYLRKMAEKGQQQAALQQQQQNERADREEKFRNDQFEYTKTKDAAAQAAAAATAADRQRENDRKFVLGGGKLESGGMTVSAAPPEAPAGPRTRPIGTFETPGGIGAAMTQGFNPAAPAPTSALQQPVAPGGLGTLPKVQYGDEPIVPEHYDKASDPKAQLAADKAAADERIAGKRDAAAMERAKVAATSRLNAAQARLEKGPNGTKAMTANVREAANEKDAFAIIVQNNGKLDAAQAFLDGPDGKEYKDSGITARHLNRASAKFLNDRVTAATNLQTKGLGRGVGESIAMSDSTRSAIFGAMGQPKPPVPPTGDTPAATPLKPASVAPVAPAPTKAAVPDKATPEIKAKYAAAAAKYKQLLETPGVTQAEAQAAYNAVIARITKGVQ